MANKDHKSINRIALLTSGGDASGMNPCIRAVVRTALFNNIQVLGFKEGFVGLIRGDYIMLGARNVGSIIQKGGTMLQTARSDEFKSSKGQREALRELNEAEVDALIVIGGDGSLKGAHALVSEGIQVIGIPASIDNDIWGTNMSIGVDTALNTIRNAIDQLRDTASSHNRAFLIETMGRNCGYLAVMAGIIGGAEIVLLPEVDVDVSEVADVVEAAYKRGKTHSIIIVAEGASISSQELAKQLDEMDVGFKTRVTILGHIQRGGSPTAFDRLLAARMGVRAVEALIDGETNKMVGLNGKEITLISLDEVISNSRRANLEYYEMARMLAF